MKRGRPLRTFLPTPDTFVECGTRGRDGCINCFSIAVRCSRKHFPCERVSARNPLALGRHPLSSHIVPYFDHWKALFPNLLRLCDYLTHRIQTCHEFLLCYHQGGRKLHDIIFIPTLADNVSAPAQCGDDLGHAVAVGLAVFIDELDALPESDRTNFCDSRNIVQSATKPLEAWRSE